MSYKPYLRPAYPNELFHSSSELYHHGINGQKWGVRRFQNPDGTLTAAGKQRYNVGKTANNDKTGHKNDDSNTSMESLADKYYYEEDDPGIFTKEDISDKYPDATISIDTNNAKKENVSPKALMDSARRMEKNIDSMVKSSIDKIMEDEYEEFSNNSKDPLTGRKLSFEEFKSSLEEGSQRLEVYPWKGKTLASLSVLAPAPYKNRVEYIGEWLIEFDAAGNIKYVSYND